MRRGNVLVAATLAALMAAPVSAAVDVKPYGFVNVTYLESFGRGNNVNNPNSATSSNATSPNGYSNTYGNFDASSSRFGLKLSGGKGPMDMDLAGVVEMDFNGDTAASSAGSIQRAPRIRLAYMQMSKGINTFIIGQDWTNAFEPIRPLSIIHIAQALGTGAGNLYNRLAQVRWEADWMKGSDTDIVTRVAALRNWTADESGTGAGAVTTNENSGSGDASGIPMFQANAELHQKLMGRVMRIGVGGQYRRNKYNQLNASTPAGLTSNVNDDLLADVHFSLPVLPVLEINGAGFYGHGENAFLGADSKFVSDAGRPDSAMARGGWAQAIVKPMDGWRFTAFYGVTDVDSTFESNGSTHRNEEMQFGVIYDVSPELALSVEGGHVHTMFVGSGSTTAAGTAPGQMSQVALGAQYKF